MPRINVQGSGHQTPPPMSGFQWLPFTDASYIAVVQQAFAVIESRIRGYEPCNAAFRALPNGRSFADLWSDPNIWVSFDPDGRATTFGGTLRNDITVSRYACRMGHWTVVATLVHELAHVGGVREKTDKAEAMLKACLMRTHYNPYIIGRVQSSASSSALVATNGATKQGAAAKRASAA